MDDLIEEILAEFPDPASEGQQLSDLDDHVPHPVRLLGNESWVVIFNSAKAEFEVDDAATVFFTLRVEGEVSLDIVDIEIADGMHARAGRLSLDSRIADARANQFLAVLKGRFYSETQVSPWEIW